MTPLSNAFIFGLFGGILKILVHTAKKSGFTKIDLKKEFGPKRLFAAGIFSLITYYFGNRDHFIYLITGYVVIDIIEIFNNYKRQKAPKVHTFIARRYFPAKLLIRMLFQNKPISVLDIGCSLNLGLPAIAADNKGEKFIGILANKIPSKYYQGKVNIENGLGIDSSKVTLDQVLADVHPDEASEKDIITQTHTAFRSKSSRIKFKQMSALELNKHPELASKFDVVIATGMLYQLSADEKKQLFKQISYIAKPQAWLITSQYYKRTADRSLFPHVTLVYQINHGKIQAPLEFVRAEDTYSRYFIKGEDFSVLTKLSSIKPK